MALQSKQGYLMTNPTPLHLSHSKCITIPPLRYTVEPEPPQDKQRVGAVPGLHLLPSQVGQALFLLIFNSA